MLLDLRTTIFCLAGIAGSAAAAEDWSYQITPYIWAPSLDTSLGIGANPPVEDSKNLLDIIDGAFLIMGEARKNDWAIFGEFNYLNVSDDFGISEIDPAAGWRLRGTMLSIGAAYTFYQSNGTRIEALGGLRRWDLEASTTVLNTSASADLNWTDPIVGLRFATPISEKFQFEGMANIGGFGAGSEFQWEVLAQAEWTITDLISVAGGYRHLDIDFDDGGVINMQMSGPFVALSFNF